MHFRTSRVSRRGKTYEYAQLVESYRRESDGMPAHRVIASLGNLAHLDVENLRTALTAARDGRRVVLAPAPRREAAAKPAANLRYLDLAVMLELWREWQLDQMLQDVLPSSAAEISAALVVCALTLQRCIDPASKLYATRWMPRTALPELLAIAPPSFNNTRVHRVLEALEESTDLLMAKLVQRYQERQGAFATLFVDVTDTWFIGHGPTLAERAKTKEGRVQRKIGIVLLCNEHGYPLRWEVVAGRAHDSVTMGALLRSIAGLSWAQHVPVVCDRAMGKTAQLRELLGAKLHFVTALTTPEFEAYVPQIPCGALSGLEPPAQAAHQAHVREAVVAAATQRAIDAGLTREADNLFVRDFGVVERVADTGATAVETARTAAQQDVTILAMQHCRDIEADLATARYGSATTAARVRGISKSLASKYRSLRTLPDAMQRQILDGRAKGHSLADLLRIAQLADAEQQLEAFEALVRTAALPRRGHRAPPPHNDQAPPAPIRVRAVVYFNPDRFVDERLRARAQLDRIQHFVDDLNAGLASPRSRMKPPQILAAVDRELRKDDLLEAFRCEVHTDDFVGRKQYRVTLSLVEKQWARRRRYDGFSVIVAHPEVAQDGAALCRLYRDKDTVEKDFQAIKSLAELRPVRHRDDAKVRAHVTLCMLALLLERTLEHKLDGLCSPNAALEILAPVHLNRYQANNGTSTYLITHTDDEQAAILRRLRLRRLALDEDLAARITPR